MNSGDIAAAIIMPSILIATIIIIMVILNHRIKIKMINAGHVDENSVKLLNTSFNNLKFDALKWGLVLLFGGLGLVLLNYLPYNDNSPFPFGVEAVCLAIGFLVYYFITRSEDRYKAGQMLYQKSADTTLQ
jgi:hypothetical protein